MFTSVLSARPKKSRCQCAILISPSQDSNVYGAAQTLTSITEEVNTQIPAAVCMCATLTSHQNFTQIQF